MYGRTHPVEGPLEWIDLRVEGIPDRWYNVIPDLPRAPDELIDGRTGQPLSQEYLERMLPRALAAQERSLERWISVPDEVAAVYRQWRPAPLYRAHALERELETPAEIYFKYEGASPSGSHKLNSALAQAYYAKREGVRRLVTDTGAGQWGAALAMAGALMGIEVMVYMVRASYHHKPGRRHLMETFGATVRPSPGHSTEVGRHFLDEDPDHPGSEATAVSEALEVVASDPDARFSMAEVTLGLVPDLGVRREAERERHAARLHRTSRVEVVHGGGERVGPDGPGRHDDTSRPGFAPSPEKGERRRRAGRVGRERVVDHDDAHAAAAHLLAVLGDG